MKAVYDNILMMFFEFICQINPSHPVHLINLC